MTVLVRDATRDDVPAILAIYNDAVLHTTATYDLEPVTLADRQVESSLKITCQAAQAGIISGQAESCAVTGNGALLMVLFGFVGSLAMAKFLLRGEVIE